MEDIPTYRTELWRVGDVEPLYGADVYAIGRIDVLPDGERVLFSQVMNMESFIGAIVQGDYDPMGGDFNARRDYTPTNLYQYDLATGEISIIIEAFNQFEIAS